MQTDRRAVMTKVIGAFCDYAKVPKIEDATIVKIV